MSVFDLKQYEHYDYTVIRLPTGMSAKIYDVTFLNNCNEFVILRKQTDVYRRVLRSAEQHKRHYKEYI